MCHPERSAHAHLGPADAAGGRDTGFLRNPVMRTTRLPDSLDIPSEWMARTPKLARRRGSDDLLLYMNGF